MRKLGDILQETPPRTIANYLVWRVLKNLVIALPKEFQQLQEKFKYAVDGTTRMYSRWYRCVTLVNDNMGLAVGRLFVEKYFDEESKTEALDMIHKIRNAFVNNVKESVSWMDEKTKEVATEKAATMLEKIGYPPYVLNNKELNANYEQLTISADNYFENMLACFRHTAIHDLKQLSLTPNRTRWEDINIVMVNAAYSPNKNQILFSAGMLQPPFYSKYYPRSMNFGGIGMVIGHEITHGLDDQGRLYDKNGNLREWWDETTSERFKEKARCFIEQYGNYTVEDVNMKINGKLTQGENIADNGGLKQAFQAYRNWVSKRGQEEERLPGLNMSHNQIFFLSFAHMLCGHQRPKSTVDQIRTDTHTTLKYR
ncbi:neprilysin-4-like [Lingula anatina]|nr:neprilysin-4-like [Lingula anatina]|eukprot:XP_023931148.1 neprilysin-4-like [Lingula anatina]